MPARRRSGASGRIGYGWRAALVAAVLAGGLWTATRHVAGVTWGDVFQQLGQVSGARLGLLALVWLVRAHDLCRGAVGRPARSRGPDAACCST